MTKQINEITYKSFPWHFKVPISVASDMHLVVIGYKDHVAMPELSYYISLIMFNENIHVYVWIPRRWFF